MQEFSARHEIGDGWPHALIGIGGKYSHFFILRYAAFLGPGCGSYCALGGSAQACPADPVLYGFGGHISDALKHQFVDKHGDAFNRMVTQQSATLIYRNMVFPSGTVFRAVNG